MGSLLGANQNAYMNSSVHTQSCETLEHKHFAKDSLGPLRHTDASRVSLPWHGMSWNSALLHIFCPFAPYRNTLERKLSSLQFLCPSCPDAENGPWTNKQAALKIGLGGSLQFSKQRIQKACSYYFSPWSRTLTLFWRIWNICVNKHKQDKTVLSPRLSLPTTSHLGKMQEWLSRLQSPQVSHSVSGEWRGAARL